MDVLDDELNHCIRNTNVEAGIAKNQALKENVFVIILAIGASYLILFLLGVCVTFLLAVQLPEFRSSLSALPGAARPSASPSLHRTSKAKKVF